LVEEGNNTTVDLYFGGMKNGEENITEAIAATRLMAIKIFFLLHKKSTNLMALNELFSEFCFNISIYISKETQK